MEPVRIGNYIFSVDKDGNNKPAIFKAPWFKESQKKKVCNVSSIANAEDIVEALQEAFSSGGLTKAAQIRAAIGVG